MVEDVLSTRAADPAPSVYWFAPLRRTADEVLRPGVCERVTMDRAPFGLFQISLADLGCGCLEDLPGSKSDATSQGPLSHGQV